jgi:hypothetical protein
VSGRVISAIAAGAAALGALIVWLVGHSDSTLARWSAIAGVVSAAVAVLALAAAAVPLLRRDGEKALQSVHAEGSVQAVVNGDINNIYTSRDDR